MGVVPKDVDPEIVRPSATSSATIPGAVVPSTNPTPWSASSVHRLLVDDFVSAAVALLASAALLIVNTIRLACSPDAERSR